LNLSSAGAENECLKSYCAGACAGGCAGAGAGAGSVAGSGAGAGVASGGGVASWVVEVLVVGVVDGPPLKYIQPMRTTKAAAASVNSVFALLFMTKPFQFAIP
jgi:hypothetical protein